MGALRRPNAIALVSALIVLGAATIGFAQTEILIQANAATVPIGDHLGIELEYETGGQPVDVYAVVLLTDGSFFSFLGAGQFSPQNTLVPLARAVSGRRVNVTLLDLEPLPTVPLGTYRLAAGIVVAGQPPLAPGNLITASVASFNVTPTTPHGGGQVRVLYVMPQDREFRADYYAAVANAVANLKGWYRSQLNGETFSRYSADPEICQLAGSSDYYAIDSWSKVLSDVQACAPVSHGSSVFAWILYVDIVHACNAPGRLGAGGNGVTMLPRQDMDGLIGAQYFDDCGVEYVQPPSRYIGGLGHELGHALGLNHPQECDAGLPTCDHDALMWTGYAAYPNTYLRPDDKLILFASPFIR